MHRILANFHMLPESNMRISFSFADFLKRKQCYIQDFAVNRQLSSKRDEFECLNSILHIRYLRNNTNLGEIY
jgi:hypothetical protein